MKVKLIWIYWSKR